jgi:hypothetical protein
MEKLDLRKQYKALYAPSAKEVTLVTVPAMKFVLLDGEIEPGQEPASSPAFQEGTSALYGASFTLKFMSKLNKESPIDYAVMALEGLWWAKAGTFDIQRKDTWCWTLMMAQPNHITAEMFQEALRQLKKKKDSPSVSRLRFEAFDEGLSVQIMHIGPYADEPRSIDKMNAFALANGYQLCGKHHEIYMGDPRKAQPDKLKTILRHPVEKCA